mmetsp:Transcript_14943/g.37220  ORF Transcript_14943/g.37220 Transcript_14943/m.37220 type:complete len:268 (+) Transcript_14943:2286-3089(+)
MRCGGGPCGYPALPGTCLGCGAKGYPAFPGKCFGGGPFGYPALPGACLGGGAKGYPAFPGKCFGGGPCGDLTSGTGTSTSGATSSTAATSSFPSPAAAAAAAGGSAAAAAGRTATARAGAAASVPEAPAPEEDALPPEAAGAPTGTVTSSSPKSSTLLTPTGPPSGIRRTTLPNRGLSNTPPTCSILGVSSCLGVTGTYTTLPFPSSTGLNASPYPRPSGGVTNPASMSCCWCGRKSRFCPFGDSSVYRCSHASYCCWRRHIVAGER